MPLMRAIGRFAVRYRYLVIAVWLVATLACIYFLPSLSSVSSSDTGLFLPSSEPSQRAAQLASPFQHATGSTASLIVTHNGGALTPADEVAITQLEMAILRVAHVTTVRDQGISADGQARKALIAVDVSTSSTQAAPIVGNIRAAVSDAQLPPGLAANITGQLPTSVDTQAASQKAQQLTQLFSDIAILLMLLIVYRAALAPLLNLAPAVLVLLLSERVIAQASLAGLPVSNVTQTILTVLILGAGTDYGLFLILRVHEELRRGLSPHDAVIEAVAQVGESITFSGGTVIAALLCLLFAVFGIYQGLGPSLAIGVGVMLLAGLTLLPALLAVFGRAAFWPLHATAGAEKPGAWGRIAGQITQRPLVTLLLGVVFFGGLSLVTLAYAPGGFAGSSTGPTGSDSAAGTTALQAHYPAAVVNPSAVVLTFPTSVWSNLTPVAQAEQQLSAASQFQSVSGPFNPNGHTITPAQVQAL